MCKKWQAIKYMRIEGGTYYYGWACVSDFDMYDVDEIYQNIGDHISLDLPEIWNYIMLPKKFIEL